MGFRGFEGFVPAGPFENTGNYRSGATWHPLVLQKGCSRPLWRPLVLQKPRSKPLWSPQELQKGCSRPLWSPKELQKGLFKITLEPTGAPKRLLSNTGLSTTLLWSYLLPCMDMHGFTLVYIYVPLPSPCSPRGAP